MKKVRNGILTGGIVFAVLISSANLALTAIEFEKGEPSQIRELILKQKQEKKRLVTEKYKKQKQGQETAVQEKTKLETSKNPGETQEQPASFIRLKTLLIIGLLLLTILSITLGITINRRRQGK
ncbi:MAG: hypothetical protein ABIF11_03065 [Nitrospirota bacterium]